MKAPKQRRVLIALGILLACCPRTSALDPALDVSQYAHTAWKVREGFSKGYINAIAQTPDGYLWLGTEYGLLRFDGVRNVPWQPPVNERLPSSFVRALLAARDGRLWIGTDNGLASWKDGKLAHYPEFDGLDLYTLLEDRQGTVWAGGMASPTGKLCAIQNGSTLCYGEDGSLGRGVRSLYEDSGGGLWAAADTGLWRLKPGSSELLKLSRPVPEIHALNEDNNGALLIGTISGMRRLVDGKAEGYPLSDIGPQFNSTKLLRDHDCGLWIGTRALGLLHVHQERTDVFAQSDGLSGDSIRALFEDREGNIWVATTNGIDRFRNFAVATISVKQGLSNPEAGSVLAARDGSVWLGTVDGLNRWNNGQITIYRKRRRLLPRRDGEKLVREVIDEGLPDDYAGSLLQDRQGRIWVSTPRGVAYFENGRFIPVSSVPGGYVHAIAEDSAGDIWIAPDQGLFHLQQRRVVEQIPWGKLGHHHSTFSLVADSLQGGLWLGFWHGGIAYFKDGQVRASYGGADGLGEGRVNSFQLDQDGTLWAATEGGLSRLKNGRIATLTSKNGLPCDSVNWMMEDDAHSFWLNMACGLVRITQTELNAWVAAAEKDPKRAIQTTVFDSSDGMRSHAFPSASSPRVAKTADGKLWFLPLDGVSIVDPRHLPVNKLPPPIHIEQITADRKTYWSSISDASSHLRLPPLSRDLEIDYTALSFVAPEKIRFRYKLEGQDPDWKEVVNDRQAQYSNLPPGNYRFRVTACNNSGVWNEEGAALDFMIPPAWYQTNWFRTACGAALLGLIWGVYLLRIQQVRKQEEKFREAVESMPALAFVALSENERTFVNKGWVEYTGLTLVQASGSGWQAAVHPDELKRVLDKWRSATAAGEPFYYELRLRHGSTGEYRWFHTRVVPLRDKRGKVVKWCGLATDIEDRKRAEQLQADLAHTNRVSMLGELAASISHELKQPIAATMTNARTSIRWLKREPPDLEEVRLAAERIEKDGARATAIIDRLRALYKKTPPKREPVDVNEIIGEMVVMLRGEANRSGVSIRTDLAADFPKITADRVQLQQVLMNLMLNGMEAMKDTGGVLTVRSQAEDGHVLISVRDTGVGLPPEKADKVFDAFFTTKPQGSGMGLAISRSIIESHGGRLWATANSGRGATFHFTLPNEATAPSTSAGYRVSSRGPE